MVLVTLWLNRLVERPNCERDVFDEPEPVSEERPSIVFNIS